MRWWVMFREIICIIIASPPPINQEVTLLDAIADPVKAHVNGFGPPLLDGGIGDACGTCVVSLDGRCHLWVAHFFQGRAEHGCIFCVVKECTKFGFCRRGDDHLEDGAVHVNWAIEGQWW